MASTPVVAVAGAAALIATPIAYNYVQSEAALSRARYDGKPFPKNATPYPGIGQMILGHPSNTSMPGLVIGLTVFGASAVAARGLVFGSLHKSLAKRIMVDPATGFQKRINSLPDFLASLVPAFTSGTANLLVAAVPAAAAKGWYEGVGRYENWGPNYYSDILKKIEETPITGPRHKANDHH